MKSSMKKLTVLGMIAAIAMFAVVAMASAFDRDDHPKAIQGQYAATGSGTCYVAPFGLDDNLVPINGAYMVMTFTMEGVFTFYPDRKGHIERPHCPVVILTPTPYNPPSCPSCSLAGDSKDSSDFTYEVEREGSITLTQVPGSHSGEFTSGPLVAIGTYHNNGRNWRGTVSPDGETIILNSGLPDIITSPGQTPPNPEGIICNTSAVLIRQHN
jgi:hypothetical protein